MDKLAGYISVLLLMIPAVGMAQKSSGIVQTPDQALTRSQFPSPPRQFAAWQIPQTSLPQTLSTATVQLFEQGLADPRACEYREVEILVHSIWTGTGTVLKTHAWVLPQQANTTQRFVVAWNGLIYPTQSVGGPADLRNDVNTAIEIDRTNRAKAASNFPTLGGYRHRSALPEAYSASHLSLLSLKTCLLLRLGETLLAEQVWAQWISGMDAQVNDDALHLQDPYLMLATDWLWARWERTLCAHMRGDDLLALEETRALNLLRNTLSGVVEKRSAHWPDTYKNRWYLQSYFAFLQPVPIVLADQERRAKDSRLRSSVGTIRSQYGDNHSELVAALIAELDQVSAHQWGQPGGVDFGEDQIVRALIAQGDSAVQPLLLTLSNDVRLTRSVRFSRDFHRDRYVIPVFEVAYRMLSEILKVSQPEVSKDWEDLTRPGLEGRQALAIRLKERWQKQRQAK